MAKRKATARRRPTAAAKRAAAPKRRASARKATARKATRKVAKTARPAAKRKAKKTARKAAPKASAVRVIRRVTKKAAAAAQAQGRCPKAGRRSSSRRLHPRPQRPRVAQGRRKPSRRASRSPRARLAPWRAKPKAMAAARRQEEARARARPRAPRRSRTTTSCRRRRPPRSASIARPRPPAPGRQELKERYDKHNETSPALTGGDVDADWESAYSVGDEAPGGDNPTPDQNNVDDIGVALGVEYAGQRRARGRRQDRGARSPPLGGRPGVVGGLRGSLRIPSPVSAEIARGVARVAAEAPRLGARRPARLRQEAHRPLVARLGRGRRRGALLRLDRQQAPAARRQLLPADLHAAQAEEPLVRAQQEARGRADQGRADDAGRPGGHRPGQEDRHVVGVRSRRRDGHAAGPEEGAGESARRGGEVQGAHRLPGRSSSSTS